MINLAGLGGKLTPRNMRYLTRISMNNAAEILLVFRTHLVKRTVGDMR